MIRIKYWMHGGEITPKQLGLTDEEWTEMEDEARYSLMNEFLYLHGDWHWSEVK